MNRMKHKDVFSLINKHVLFDSITDRIVQLMQFDREKAVKLLLDNIDKVPVSVSLCILFNYFSKNNISSADFSKSILKGDHLIDY